MKPKILKTNAEYKTALMQLQKLMHAKPGTPRADSLELRAKLIEEYENIHHPIEAPDPVEAILFRMGQENLKPKGTQ